MQTLEIFLTSAGSGVALLALLLLATKPNYHSLLAVLLLLVGILLVVAPFQPWVDLC